MMDHDFSTSPDTNSRNTESSEMTSVALGAVVSFFLALMPYSLPGRASVSPMSFSSTSCASHAWAACPFPLAPFVWVLCFRVLPWPTLISSKLSMIPPPFSYCCCLLLAYHCLITFFTFFKVMCWVKLQSFRERALSQMPTPVGHEWVLISWPVIVVVGELVQFKDVLFCTLCLELTMSLNLALSNGSCKHRRRHQISQVQYHILVILLP